MPLKDNFIYEIFSSLEKIDNFKPRIKAATTHFFISVIIAITIACLIFLLWYPAPHHILSSGINLFLILISIDLTLGPLMTLVIFNKNKPNRELFRDVTIIALLQLLALIYGMNIMFQARPAYIVFEYNRFQVIYASDLSPELLAKAPQELRHLPITGPKYLSLRPMQNKEKLDLLLQELSGFPLAYRTDMWRPYSDAKARVISAGTPAETTISSLPYMQRKKMEKIISEKNISVKDVLHVPLLSRSPEVATVFIHKKDAEVLSIINTPSE